MDPHSETFDELFAAVCKWFDDAIPHSAEDDVTKFKEEAAEFVAAPSAEEAADALMCLVHFCELKGLDLKAAVRAKFEKNKGRTWARMPDGTWHHVKPAPTTHGHRCLTCGRAWLCDGLCQTADGRCLACGSVQADWERTGESIDFRSQHTESGEPRGDQG